MDPEVRKNVACPPALPDNIASQVIAHDAGYHETALSAAAPFVSTRPHRRGRRMTRGWLLIFVAVFAWSGYKPADFFTWVLEVSPAVVGLAVLLATRRSFPLTGLLYWLILLHCIVLMVGGHYTYAEVPLFDWIRDGFGLQRNNYDKVGHLLQGFVPALIARELLLRKQVVRGRGWLNFVVLCFCLALSAFYELIEWLVALAVGISAEAFLGTQGYSWDTQSDMAWALAGAVFALLLLSRYHDRVLLRYGFVAHGEPGRDI